MLQIQNTEKIHRGNFGAASDFEEPSLVVNRLDYFRLNTSVTVLEI